MTKLKQDRTRRSGHKHSQNAQDFPRTVYTPAQRRHYLRAEARAFVRMIEVWGEGTLLEREAGKAAGRLADVLDVQIREKNNA